MEDVKVKTRTGAFCESMLELCHGRKGNLGTSEYQSDPHCRRYYFNIYEHRVL